jgi:O-antigen/teichoic acid export membrane protein
MRLSTKDKVPPVWRRVSEVTHGGDAAATTLTNLILGVLGMCSGIFVARLLGPGGRGELAAIQTVPSFVGTLAMIGMPEAVVYYSARQPGKAGRYLGSGVALATLASVPFIICAYALMPSMLKAQQASVIQAARSYLWIGVLYATVGMLLHPLRGRSDFLSWNCLRLLVPVSWIGVLTVAWCLNIRTASFIADINLIATALLFFPFALVTLRRIPGPYWPELQQFGRMTAYGFPCMMTGLPQTLNFRMDQMLMGAFFAPRALGVYAVAVAWSGAVAPLLNAIGVVILPYVASADDRRHAVSRFIGAVRITSLLALGICTGVAMATPFAMRILFGTRYQDAIPSALVLVPASGLLGINLSLQEGMRGLGHPYAALQAEAIGLLVTAIGLATMLRPLGILGAAVASVVAYSAVTASMLGSAKRILGISALGILLPRSKDVAIGFRRISDAISRRVAAN